MDEQIIGRAPRDPGMSYSCISWIVIAFLAVAGPWWLGVLWLVGVL